MSIDYSAVVLISLACYVRERVALPDLLNQVTGADSSQTRLAHFELRVGIQIDDLRVET